MLGCMLCACACTCMCECVFAILASRESKVQNKFKLNFEKGKEGTRNG